jgi:hypothetical protein
MRAGLSGVVIGSIVLACGEAGAPFEPDGRVLDAPIVAAAAIPLTEVQHFSTEFTQFLPCANGGAGEDIDWTGELQLVFHSTTLLTKSGELKTLLAAFNTTGSLDGVGRTTGERYTGKYSSHGPVHEREILGSSRFNHNLVFDIQVRSARGGLVGIQSIRAHTTVTPDGDVVLERFDFEFQCRQK